jgi:prepilin-type N-terminal cleavage/methylation domain-containing protein/prepilin-type processing-associated H-X9-DG protein
MWTRRRWLSNRAADAAWDRGATRAGRRCGAFTLIELLVVVSIIALLISILLPSLASARDQAKAIKCSAQLSGLGRGLAAYTADYNDWIPGMNTSGVKAMAMLFNQTLNDLRRPSVPVQHFDWATPIMRLEMELPNNRAKRLAMLTEKYRCPAQASIRSVLYGDPKDIGDFEALSPWTALSYLMPVNFQYWGKDYSGYRLTGAETVPQYPIYAKVVPDFFEVSYDGYTSRMERIGAPGRKVFLADGTRYLTETLVLDHDVTPLPTYFGSFSTSGAWWSGSVAYGVQAPGTNWDGNSLTRGSPSGGRNLALSYRHGGQRGASTSCQANKGSINAAFFDGHVERLRDRASRDIVLWYPRGAVVQPSAASECMTTVQPGYVVP